MAQPVDTYARPERPQESNSLLQLAQTLGDINPALQRFAEVMQPQPKDSYAAALAYRQTHSHEEIMRDIKVGNPPAPFKTLEGMRALGEDVAYQDAQKFIERYNTDFDKDNGDPDALWREVAGDTYKQFGNDRAFMEVYTKAAEEARRKVMAANNDYKAEQAQGRINDAVYGSMEGRVQNMIDEGKSGDQIAASLFSDLPKNKQFLQIPLKDQQKYILQIADRYATRGQFDIARGILQFERKDGAYKGSLLTDRELGDKANDLMARIDTEQQKAQLAASSAQEEEGVYDSALKLAQQGGVNAIEDVQIHDKTGDLKTISADSIRKEVSRRMLDEVKSQADYAAITPEEKAALANKLEKEKFIGNGLEHPVWFQTMKNAAGQMSLNALSGKIPPTGKDAYKLYKELYAESPQYLSKYLDSKSVDFFEAARVLEESGKAETPDDALLAAGRATSDVNQQPEALKLQYQDIDNAVSSAANDGWFWDTDFGNKGYAKAEIVRSAKIFARVGMDTKDAIAEAEKTFKKTHITVAGTWLQNDKRLPTDFADLAQQYLNEFADKHGKELGVEADDLTIDRLGNGTGAWIVLLKGDRQPPHVPNADRMITLSTLDAIRKRNRDKVMDQTIKDQNNR